MSAKKSAEVLIGGKVYTMSGYEEEEYLQKVAAYINNKINDYNTREDYRRFSADMKATLVELNIADDYFKARAQVEKYESDIAEKDKELYDLKHDRISEQIRIETLEEQVKNLESENKELKALKAKLEASLEESLLGSLDAK